MTPRMRGLVSRSPDSRSRDPELRGRRWEERSNKSGQSLASADKRNNHRETRDNKMPYVRETEARTSRHDEQDVVKKRNYRSSEFTPNVEKDKDTAPTAPKKHRKYRPDDSDDDCYISEENINDLKSEIKKKDKLIEAKNKESTILRTEIRELRIENKDNATKKREVEETKEELTENQKELEDIKKELAEKTGD